MSRKVPLDPRKGIISLIPSMGSPSKDTKKNKSVFSGPLKTGKGFPISVRTKEELAKKEAEITLKGELLQQGLSDAPQEMVLSPRLVEVTAEEFVELPVEKSVAEPVGGVDLNDLPPEDRIRTAPQKSLDLILYDPERVDPPLKKEKEVYIPASWTSHKSSGKVKRKNRNNK